MRRILALFVTTAIMVAMLALPASAQPVFTGGLVNVTVTAVDVADVGPTTVQVPIGVAANLCDVNVQVLAQDLEDDGEASCTATNESRAVNSLKGLNQ